jgi:hypothetical protein
MLEEGCLSWVDFNNNPNGVMIDLGTFFMEEVSIIKFELFNRVPISFGQILQQQNLFKPRDKQPEENMETEVVDI